MTRHQVSNFRKKGSSDIFHKMLKLALSEEQLIPLIFAETPVKLHRDLPCIGPFSFPEAIYGGQMRPCPQATYQRVKDEHSTQRLQLL